MGPLNVNEQTVVDCWVLAYRWHSDDCVSAEPEIDFLLYRFLSSIHRPGPIRLWPAFGAQRDLSLRRQFDGPGLCLPGRTPASLADRRAPWPHPQQNHRRLVGRDRRRLGAHPQDLREDPNQKFFLADGTRRQNNFSRKIQCPQAANHPPRQVDLPPSKPMARRTGEGMVVVVPAFAVTD